MSGVLAYFDCFCGASGDMIMGALLDAGCPQAELRDGLAALRLSDATIEILKVKKQGFAATRFIVNTTAPPAHRHLHHIRKIIDDSGLSASVRERATRIFVRLAEAEAAVHNSSIEKVHFHEVGAADAIIDIVGASLAIELMRIDRVCCSHIPTGSGTVKCDHGIMPVPAPATAALLTGVPLATCEEPGELTTPTGAAVLTTLADSYGPMPAMQLRNTGYGAGTRDGKTRPNIMRVLIGDALGGASASDAERDVVVVLEANLDDATGQQMGYAIECLLAAGALDVFCTPISMKKGRPGIMLSVIATVESANAMQNLMLSHTPTFGVRRTTWDRAILARTIEQVDTAYGPIAIKVGRRDGAVIHAMPEYEQCAAAARAHGVAIATVSMAARAAWQAR